MLNAIRKAALSAMEAGSPIALLFGEVIGRNPLEVSVDQRFILDADFLVVPESLTRYEIDIRHTHSYNEGTTGEALSGKLQIRRELEVGDKLVMLRMQGGQKYFIVDRVVEP